MEHYAIHLSSSPIPTLSYSSKRYENSITRGSKFNLKFNHATYFQPQFTTSHKVTHSISHVNCMINNFSMPNSKNSEGSDNKILRGINGTSLVLGCILGMFNFSSMMMNSKFNMAYAAHFPPKMILVGGEISFDSMWKTINADAMESDPGEDSPDNKKMHALYLRKCGKKHAIENMVKELKEDYKKYKDDPDTEYYVRKALIELLLIQGNFEDVRTLLDQEIDNHLRKDSKMPFLGSMKKENFEKKIDKLYKIYDKIDEDGPEKQSKQSIADIFLFEAILHTKLRDEEAAKWWQAFAKTLVTK
ncbi:unnamed protein product [Trifolium pratense]|uniref:Uncharacterized protein n=1 Tax=Trifolium pratense TaxID=57577 RepID=A0ACB0M7Q4_TRIPR|nr:unnamed protein product [Trifolium pratense]